MYNMLLSLQKDEAGGSHRLTFTYISERSFLISSDVESVTYYFEADSNSGLVQPTRSSTQASVFYYDPESVESVSPEDLL